MRKIFNCLILAAALILGGCSEGIRDFRVDSCKVVGVEPLGFKAVKVYLELKVHNPVAKFYLIDPSGVVKIDGTPSLNLRTSDIRLDLKGDKTVTVAVEGEVLEGLSPMSVLKLMMGGETDRLTADVTATLKLKSGVGKKIVVHDLNIGKMLNKE